MKPIVCRCCGHVMDNSADDNPNICETCAWMDWRDTVANPSTEVMAEILFPKPVPELTPSDPFKAGHASELEHWLELDQPTVLECFNAGEQAQKAIEELAIRDTVTSETTEVSPPVKPASLQAAGQQSTAS